MLLMPFSAGYRLESVKNYIRNSIDQDRLGCFTSLGIESAETKRLTLTNKLIILLSSDAERKPYRLWCDDVAVSKVFECVHVHWLSFHGVLEFKLLFSLFFCLYWRDHKIVWPRAPFSVNAPLVIISDSNQSINQMFVYSVVLLTKTCLAHKHLKWLWMMLSHCILSCPPSAYVYVTILYSTKIER